MPAEKTKDCRHIGDQLLGGRQVSGVEGRESEEGDGGEAARDRVNV